MATFQPPTFRDIGAIVPVLWQGGQYVSSLTPVTVHGDPNATYDSTGFPVGDISFDIDIDGLGVVTVQNTALPEVTSADWVATINAAYFAAHGVNPAFVDITGTLALEAATSIAVSNYLDAAAPPGDTSFSIVGLPVGTRSTTPSGTFQPDRQPTLQGVSQPLDVPRGANVVTVELYVTGIGAEPASIAWGLCLSNPTDPDPMLGVGNIVGLPFVDGAFTPSGGGYIVRQVVGDLLRSPEVPTDLNLRAPVLRFEFRAPYGTEIRLWVAVTINGPAAPLPQANPSVAATVMFSAR